ncbi:hypothetical protein NSTC745_04780 [Nostoc sp. DSM 114161]|jgi:hypothetical protein|uniref:DUF6920 family protein n=1 Tax=Nostoc sp. DSM 114161 TaxID=3440143 RepID=UPI0040454339
MFTKIFLTIGVLLAIAFIALVIIKIKNEQEVDRIWRSLEVTPTSDRFTEDMVAGLPLPVQRYFLHSIALGTPLASSVSLEMSGSFRMAQEQPWIPMRAKQIISALKIYFLRWGKRTEDNTHTYIPFGGEFTAEKTFNSYTIPSQVGAGWQFGTENYFEFFRAKIEQAEFR